MLLPSATGLISPLPQSQRASYAYELFLDLGNCDNTYDSWNTSMLFVYPIDFQGKSLSHY